MCNDHEHYTNYSTREYNYLCFRHATVEAVSGKHVDTEIVTYASKTECEVCDNEELKKFLDGHTLTKKDQISGKTEPVKMETIFGDYLKAGFETAPGNIKKALLNGNSVATHKHVYQYIKN